MSFYQYLNKQTPIAKTEKKVKAIGSYKPESNTVAIYVDKEIIEWMDKNVLGRSRKERFENLFKSWHKGTFKKYWTERQK